MIKEEICRHHIHFYKKGFVTFGEAKRVSLLSRSELHLTEGEGFV